MQLNTTKPPSVKALLRELEGWEKSLNNSKKAIRTVSMWGVVRVLLEIDEQTRRLSAIDRRGLLMLREILDNSECCPDEWIDVINRAKSQLDL